MTRMELPLKAYGTKPSTMIISGSVGHQPTEADQAGDSTGMPVPGSFGNGRRRFKDVPELPKGGLSRMVQYRSSQVLDMQLSELCETSDRETFDKVAAGLVDTHGWRTALVVAERARELTLSGDWEAAKTWRRLFEIVFARMTATDRPVASP